ncbi:MAG: FAD-dependent oxidoreductase [Candidatus Omnitrophica bacterium]|nr:FAD-dependent oxidoreductase [Candidatus Omnitrophota bacterium]MBU1869885.1 FAD-dependent oxidoreductase [Candidatus Omnitrophota bacterium]
MQKIVIVGAGIFGHSLAVALRGLDKECAVTLISDENYPAYERKKLPEFLSGGIKEEGFFLCNEDFYAKENISFIKGKKIGSLNLAKNTAYFKDKGNIEFDYLVIASGRSPELPEIPGAKKEGVYRLYSLDDAKKFSSRFITHPVCVVGSDDFSLNIAKVVSEKNQVEVKLISRNSFDPSFLPAHIEAINSSITEIIGEGEAQAIKLKEGKAIGVCAVLFVDYYRSNIDFLKNANIDVKDDLVVIDEEMSTNVSNIFALGSVTGRQNIDDVLLLALNLTRLMKGATCQTS